MLKRSRALDRPAFKEKHIKFDDKSSKHETTIFYRPSFGRGGPPRFGEFDAIVATPHSIYPIEAKWSESSEAKKSGQIILKREAEQIARHKIFINLSPCLLNEWGRGNDG